MFCGIASVATSAVPVRAKAVSTSGNFSRRVSICFWNSTDCVSPVAGMRSACTAMSPSLRLGTNSLPRRVASQPQASTSTTAPTTNATRALSANRSSGS